MEIRKITPQGFCNGVIRAMALINKNLDNARVKKPIYMYGGLVHNKHIINSYRNKGIQVIDDLDPITEGTVIITAHGVSDQVIKKIKDKGLDIINATCFDVLKTHKLIKDKIKEGYDIIVYGKKSHPETKGLMGISDKILLIEKIEDIQDLKIDNPKLVFTTQTTMSYFEVKKILNELLIKYPNIESYEEICSATKDRQQALISQVKEVDLCIVVGDPTSNNTNKLKDVCVKFTKTPCIMVESIEDLKNFDFTPYQIIGITAGASTPTAIVNEIIIGLQNSDFSSHLNDDDYLSI